MDYAEAKQAIAGMVRFLRAFSPLEDLLDLGEQAEAAIKRVETGLTESESKLAALTSNIADAEKQLATLNKTLKERWANKDAEAQAKHDKLLAELEQVLNIKQAELDSVVAKTVEAVAAHEKSVAEMESEAKARETLAAAAEKRLADAERKYAAFKEKVANL